MIQTRPESEITRLWPGFDPPLVSVRCKTYNHEPYIAQAIDSFLMQETRFPFEVIVHDDASTDNTANIIRSYAEQYPRILRTVFETENQYSKGIRSTKKTDSMARGKYLAVCEGDDFWIEPEKLTIQVQCFEDNSDLMVCLHSGKQVFENGEESGKLISFDGSGDRFLSLNELIYDFGQNWPTASIMYRKSAVDCPPPFFMYGRVGRVMSAALQGQVFYIDKPMAVHRSQAKGSWTQRHNADREFRRRHLFVMLRMFDEFDQFTQGRYKLAVDYQRQKRIRGFLLRDFDGTNSLAKEQWECLRRGASRSTRLLLPVLCLWPRLGRRLLQSSARFDDRSNGLLQKLQGK